MIPFVGETALAALPTIGNFIDSNANRKAQEEANRNNAALQKDFAQNGLRWRMEDAKRAGIHPLAAIGANVQGGSPSFQSTHVGSPFETVGQNISRAINATRTADERRLSALTIHSAELDNAIKLKQLEGMDSPPFPSNYNFFPGQGNSGPGMGVGPLRGPGPVPGAPYEEGSQMPDTTFMRTQTGLVPSIPQSSSESLEADYLGVIDWNIRNKLLPYFASAANAVGIKNKMYQPSAARLPRGASGWRWSWMGREWQPTYEEKSFKSYKRRN